MLILSLDTSAAASAALLADGRVLGRFATRDTRSHAEVLAPAIRGLLNDAGMSGYDVDAVVAGVGPGPFTGLRAGLMTARTLGFAWNVPVHGLMSLDAIALDAAGDAQVRGIGEFAVAIDARRQEVYWARYRQHQGAFELIDGPHVGSPETVPGLPVYGKGGGLYPDSLSAVDGFAAALPDASALGVVAFRRLAAGRPLLDTTPLYLRESDAQVPGPRKRALS